MAVSSPKTDMKVKPALYAAAGVPELWVVDVPGRRLHAFSEPRPGDYATTVVLGADAVFGPRHVEIGQLELRTLFAGV